MKRQKSGERDLQASDKVWGIVSREYYAKSRGVGFWLFMELFLGITLFNIADLLTGRTGGIDFFSSGILTCFGATIIVGNWLIFLSKKRWSENVAAFDLLPRPKVVRDKIILVIVLLSTMGIFFLFVYLNPPHDIHQ